MANQLVCPVCLQYPHSEVCRRADQNWTLSSEDISRDPAEEACYDIQKACWEFEDAIKRCRTAGRLAWIDGMLAESRKRVELLTVVLAARQTELES